MAEAKYHEYFQCERDETELVKKLVKFGIYGKQKTLDGIIEAKKKILTKPNLGFKILKISSGMNRIKVRIPETTFNYYTVNDSCHFIDFLRCYMQSSH